MSRYYPPWRVAGLDVLRFYGWRVFLLWLYFRIRKGPGVTVGVKPE